MSNYKTTTIARTSPPTPAATNNNNNNYITSNNIISRSNGTQACAACKYQRRKCAPDCILAPYFPHHRQRQFLNAHKLFGVSNITKIIRYLDQPDKDQAMRTIIYQSDVRANDPVGGCYRIIRDLQRQIEYTRAELQVVLHQLAICRAQNQSHQHHHHMLLALDQPNINNNNHDRGLNMMGSFDVINNYDDLQPPPQQSNNDPHHHQQQKNYLLQNDVDDEVHMHEINSWAAIQNSMLTTELEVKQSCAADECQEDVTKPLLDDVRAGGDDHIIQEFKFEFEEKTIDNVHNHLRLKTPA